MTAQNSSLFQNGQAGPRSDHFSEHYQDPLNQPDLLADRYQDVFSRDWFDFGENYASGYLALYLCISRDVDGCHDSFRFLIAKHGVFSTVESNRIYQCDGPSGAEADTARPVNTLGGDPHQTGPVFVGVSDSVDTPKGVVPSGVWFLGQKNIPLRGCEFLFYSVMSGAWERFRLPITDTAEWKGGIRYPLAVCHEYVGNHFIKGGSEVPDNFNNLKPSVVCNGLFDAYKYGLACKFIVNSSVEISLEEGVEPGFQITEFALSAFDLFS